MQPRIAVLGAGAVFRKMLPGLRSAFVIDSLYDPRLPAATWDLLSDSERAAVTGSEQATLSRVAHCDAVFILTPPREHVRQLEEVCPLRKPVFVEKPPAVAPGEVERLEECVRQNPRIYFSDFYVDVRSVALIRAFGRRLSETSWLLPQLTAAGAGNFPPDNLAGRIGPIKSANFKLLEGLGEAKSVEARPWLKDILGGGVLLDLAFHGLALYYAIFGQPLTIHHAELGVHAPGSEGTDYDHWRPEQQQAESYASLELDSAAGFKLKVEVAKNWTNDHREMMLIGSNGRLLMDFGASGGPRNVLHLDSPGLTETFKLSGNYWSLVAESFSRFIHSQAAGPHDYEESRAALQLLFEVRNFLRAQ
jgi:predicted dehydrogenase